MQTKTRKNHQRNAAARRARLARIVELPLDYVPNAGFKQADAERTILAPLPEPEYAVRKARRPSELPSYLASLYEIPLLTREQEVHLFRKYNYLKYRASQLRRQLDPARPRSVVMDQIERLYAEAVAVKKWLVQANLRLVVSIAKRYASDPDNLFNRISDGNVSLMRAIEKFDYAQGNKFSTYASWAIKNNYARDYANDMRRQDRFRTSQVELLAGTAEHRSDPVVQQSVQRHFQAQVGKVLGYLDDRERRIISRRFGLSEGDEPQTLQEVGKELGVSKERVRQLERRAMDKLRAAAVHEKIDVSEL